MVEDFPFERRNKNQPLSLKQAIAVIQDEADRLVEVRQNSTSNCVFSGCGNNQEVAQWLRLEGGLEATHVIEPNARTRYGEGQHMIGLLKINDEELLAFDVSGDKGQIMFRGPKATVKQWAQQLWGGEWKNI
ncbi:MAG TPA: hypothetical protein VMW29_02460 [Candidatus Bathyarchaeia archaeon]|nr:hypothetical protein [Candidatus Bathyarchaeia archaeon]